MNIMFYIGFYAITAFTLLIALSVINGLYSGSSVRKVIGRVTIKKCSRDVPSWYEQKTGKSYEVINTFLSNEYVVNNPEGEPDAWYRVLMEDCERSNLIHKQPSNIHQYLKVIELFVVSIVLANMYDDHMYWVFFGSFILLSALFLNSKSLNKYLYMPASILGWGFATWKVFSYYEWSVVIAVFIGLGVMLIRCGINVSWLHNQHLNYLAIGLLKYEDEVRKELKEKEVEQESILGTEPIKQEKKTARLKSQHQSNSKSNTPDGNLTKGQIGEKETAYQLRFIRDEYRIFNGIYLKGGGETQEFDHIAIGKNGVFHIESKHYYGDLHFSESHGLLRDNATVNDDPIGQMQRHEYVLRNFLKEHQIEAEITGVICFTNPDSQIFGEVPYFQTVKVGVLSSKIRSHVAKQALSSDEIDKIANLIKKKSRRSESYDELSKEA